MTEPYLRRVQSPVTGLRLSPLDLFPSLEAAYAALAALQAPEADRWGGWKLGGTNHGSRAAFGVDRLYYGAVARDEILERPDKAPGFPLYEIKGEVEIALRVAPDGTGFDAWCVALEMPSSPLEGLVELGVVALVSDRCATGALLLGPVETGPLPSAEARFVQRINGVVAADSDMAGSLVGTVDEIFADFLAMARAHGAPVTGGDWVAIGGITPCLPYAKGDRVEILLNDTVVLDVTIDTGET